MIPASQATITASPALRDVFLALLFLCLAAGSMVSYRNDLASRATARAFVRDFELDLRRPDVAMTVAVTPRFDVAADVLADATLRDAVLPVNLSEVEPAVRASWIKAMSRMDDEFGAAELLTLEAIAARPGWPYHQSLLGQLVFQRASRSFESSLTTQKEKWRMPLLRAATAAGSDITLWQSLALGYLQIWPSMNPNDRQASPIVFRRAFASPEFVGVLFGPAIQILGIREAVSFLPDSAKPLWAAFQQVVRSGEVYEAWLVHRRWDAAEWKERADDLAEIELHAQRGDLDDTRILCESWTAHHSIWSYDSPAAHRQASRLLEMWPSGRQGSWERDGRAELIRYLIDKRDEFVSGPSLERALAALDGVSSARRAQVLLLAGNSDAAQSIVRGADDVGSLAWTPYFLAAAKEARKHGDSGEARRLLARISPAATGECDTREAESALRLAASAPVDGGIGLMRLPVMAAGESQSVCVPSPGARISLELLADHPAVVDWTVDGARRGSCLIGAGGRVELTDRIRGGYALISSNALP
jgi:hypothetical protein